MITFIKNLWTVIAYMPSAVAIIRQISEVAGSEAVKSIITAVRDAISKWKSEIPEPDVIGVYEPKTQKRQRLLKRLKARIGLAFLDINEREYVALRNIKNTNTNDV